jgi:hypothetical protein
MVRYKVKADRAAENERCIAGVFEQLKQKRTPGVPGARVVAVLERLVDLRGLPRSITVDHGPEFEGQVLDVWAYKRAVRLAFIQ